MLGLPLDLPEVDRPTPRAKLDMNHVPVDREKGHCRLGMKGAEVLQEWARVMALGASLAGI